MGSLFLAQGGATPPPTKGTTYPERDDKRELGLWFELKLPSRTQFHYDKALHEKLVTFMQFLKRKREVI